MHSHKIKASLSKEEIDQFMTLLWTQITPHLSAYFRRADLVDQADDLVQETMIRMYQWIREHQIFPQFPEKYALAIAKNILRDFFRRKQPPTVSIDPFSADSPINKIADTPNETPEAKVEAREQIQQIQQYLLQLGSTTQTTILNYYITELSIPQISRMLNLSPYVIKSQLSRTLRQLREKLTEDNAESLLDFSQRTTPPLRETPSSSEELAFQVNQLREPYRQVLTLSFLFGYSASLIASNLGCPLGTVKSQLSRGRKLLAQHEARSSSKPHQQFSTPPAFPAQLPAHYREILLLRDLQQLSYGAIAKQLNLTISNVKARLHRARTACKKLQGEQQANRFQRRRLRRRAVKIGRLAVLHYVPSRFRKAVELAYVQHLSDRDIARTLDCPIGTAKTYLARGVCYLNGLTI